jgi:hypothetical protein
LANTRARISAVAAVNVPAVVAKLVDVLALHTHRLGQGALGQPERLQNSSMRISPLWPACASWSAWFASLHL